MTSLPPNPFLLAPEQDQEPPRMNSAPCAEATISVSAGGPATLAAETTAGLCSPDPTDPAVANSVSSVGCLPGETAAVVREGETPRQNTAAADNLDIPDFLLRDRETNLAPFQSGSLSRGENIASHPSTIINSSRTANTAPMIHSIGESS